MPKTIDDLTLYTFDACYPCQLAAGGVQVEEYLGELRGRLRDSYEAMATIYPHLIFSVDMDAEIGFSDFLCEICGDRGLKQLFTVHAIG